MENEHDVLELATLAGHILLENGAEVSRVEESMSRIAKYYKADSSNFFVLSNGIFTTGQTSYAKVEYIPFRGAQLERVVRVNQLSRDVQEGKYSVKEAHEILLRIRDMKIKSPLTQILGSAIGSACFCIIFGGGLMDAAAAFVVGMLLWSFVIYIASPYFSKIFSNIIGGAFVTLLCVLFHRVGFGVNLGNMIVGSIIPLIPGIAFTNGIRDIANEDYIAGITRLLDAMMVFFCIAMGVSVAFVADSWLRGSLINLNGMVTDPVTASIPIQILASFLGTIGFAVLFGVPDRHYVQTGIVGAAGWMLYLILSRYSGLGIPVSTFFAAVFVALLSLVFARLFHTPRTIFIITGIFPMVPGGGLFWMTYFTVSSQFHQALSTGFMSVKITIAIVLAIVAVRRIPFVLFPKTVR